MKNWESAFKERPDLEQFGRNAIGLFALALRFGIDDLESLAAESLTDGSDDKKCDIVFVNSDDGVAVIAQCYISEKHKNSAPSNKASDLNTAVSWLLQRPIADLPIRLNSPAKELRDSIKEDMISDLYIWYVHNLPESNNVKEELETVEATAHSAIKNCFEGKQVRIQASEIGSNELELWYTDTLSPILVAETFDIPIESGFEIKSSDWGSFVTAIPARFLHKIYKKHKTRLFSSNIRDYLGSRKSDANINYGIKKTAESDPNNFWVFNNGVTILTNSYEETKKKNKRNLQVKGVSIVNGAQTTGAIGTLSKSPAQNALVPVRFIKTKNTETIHNIIQFNNSQNKITASDFRSNDGIQKRLREQIGRIPDAEYLGGRRGGLGDAIKRKPKLLPSYTVGQALAALHLDPIVAYNQKTNIWASDKLYSKYFNEETSGYHIVFAYSLLRAVESKKAYLLNKSRKSENSLTAQESKQLEFFRHRGSTYLLVSAIATCLEIFLGRKIPNLFRLRFNDSVSASAGQVEWTKIVDNTAPLCIHLKEAITDGLKNYERVKNAIQVFESLVQSVAEANSAIYKKFALQVLSKNK